MQTFHPVAKYEAVDNTNYKNNRNQLQMRVLIIQIKRIFGFWKKYSF